MLKRRVFLKRAGAAAASALLGTRSIAEGFSAAQFSSGLAAPASQSRALSAPSGLLVNGVADPLAIDRDATRFTWRSEGGGRGERQIAYQILVASSRASLDAAKGDFWDSGRVASARSAAVEYGGKALPPAARLWWKVRIWNQSGKPGPYSVAAHFDTGLNPGEWTAQSIWDGTTNPNNFAYFRRAFSAARKPRLAKVYVSAHNDYILWFNGELLGRGPARSDPYHYGQYNGYDVTGLVRAGANVFAAIAHWQGNWHDSGVNAEPAFLLEAHLDYDGEESTTIGTDASWRVLARTAFLEDDAVYFGGAGGAKNRAAIRYDSRLEPKGWKTAGFDDAQWARACVVDRSGFRLFAQMAPLEREQSALEPVSITRAGDAWLVDFGRCIDGWPKLTLRSNRPGDQVRVAYFQMTDERNPAGWDEYTCSGGAETWDADCGRHTSFQVLKITGYAGKLRPADVRGIWAWCDADVAGRFHCSSPLVNSVYTLCERSARQNVQQAIISVDADREQSPWLADSWNIGNVLLYNHRATTMVDKVLRDYAGEQMPSGDFYACSPAAAYEIAEWSMYWPMLLWQQYLFSGDATLLEEMAPRLTRFLDWIKTYQDPGTRLLNPPGWRISDWAGGNMPSGGWNVATACQYCENLRIAAQIFAVLGRSSESKAYAQAAEAARDGINAHLWNGEYYLARTDRTEMYPLASAWPLRFGLEPPAAKSKILHAILEGAGPESASFKLGGYGGDAFYSGLLSASAAEFVVRDLARYRPMLESNRACWEGFHLNAGLEVNHAWTSYPAYLLLKYIVGIQPTSGGFATFDLRPATGGLAFAEGAVPTVKGLISARWENKSGDRFRLAVEVPANTEASVYIPKPADGDFVLSESGRRLWPAAREGAVPGVRAVEEQDTWIKCLVGSGSYQFTRFPMRSDSSMLERQLSLDDGDQR
jgi:alpha-L-rhamnosidase